MAAKAWSGGADQSTDATGPYVIPGQTESHTPTDPPFQATSPPATSKTDRANTESQLSKVYPFSYRSGRKYSAFIGLGGYTLSSRSGAMSDLWGFGMMQGMMRQRLESLEATALKAAELLDGEYESVDVLEVIKLFDAMERIAHGVKLQPLAEADRLKSAQAGTQA